MSAIYLPLLRPVHDRIAGRVLILMGAPGTVVDLATALNHCEITCYQMDRYQADRLREQLSAHARTAKVVCTADVWDIPETFDSAVFPSPPHGERELKLDLMEQSYHVLRDRGLITVLSPVSKDQFFPPLLKKIFGKVAMDTDRAGTTLWAARDGERKRRRHEITFTAKLREREYIPFISRPGVFAYGRLDEGSKSMLDVLETRSGDRIAELGCGCGAVGIIAALRSGPHTHLTLADSNMRAVAVAQVNAQKHGLTDFTALVTTDFSNLHVGEYDLALANPPYFAQHTISRLFIERAHSLLRRGGRLYLVTKQLDPVEPIIEEFFPPPVLLERRGYAVIVATKA
ncbi:MAG: class I SAM-dependent methyltransferase [Gemmataceae bacterium]